MDYDTITSRGLEQTAEMIVDTADRDARGRVFDSFRWCFNAADGEDICLQTVMIILIMTSTTMTSAGGPLAATDSGTGCACTDHGDR